MSGDIEILIPLTIQSNIKRSECLRCGLAKTERFLENQSAVETLETNKSNGI